MPFLLALALVVSASGAAVGDPELAKFLLQHGKEALQKGNAGDALTKLEKARTEDPSLVEATYWIAAALEARNDPSGAAAEYRAFLDSLAAPGSSGTPSKELAALQRKAQGRLNVLDAGRIEIERAHEAFGAQIVELARRHASSDRDLALRALRLLLAVHPKHTAGAELLRELTGEVAGADAPLAGLGDLWDLVKSHGLGGNDGWTYGEGRIDIRLEKGAITVSPSDHDSGPTYGMEAEIERTGVVTPGRASVVGLTLGWTGEEGFGVLIMDNRLVIETVGRRGHSALASMDLAEWAPGQRRTLAVRVEGVRITAFVDGKQALQKQIEGRAHLGGNIGVILENCILTLHRLVFARPGTDPK